MPKSWSERFLELEAPGVVWLESKSSVDVQAPENMRGMVDQRSSGPGRILVTVTIMTPGPRAKGQTLRLIEGPVYRGVITGLPVAVR